MKMTTVCFAAVLALRLGAESLAPSVPAEWKGADVTGKNEIFLWSGKTVQLSSANAMAVDPAKKYVFSGEFRLASGSHGKAAVYFGLQPLDSRQAAIAPFFINPVTGTDTVLVKQLSSKDKILFVKDASMWKRGPRTFLAMDTKEDFSDLPNSKVVEISSISERNDGWEIVLKDFPWRNLPAGTGVRQHSDSAAAIYASPVGGPLSAEWKTFKGTLHGTAPKGISFHQCWVGMRFAKLLILLDRKDSSIEFRNVRLEEAE